MAQLWRNTDSTYGTIAKVLHWGMAFLFLGAYMAIYYRHWFVEKGLPLRTTLAHLHFSFGLSIGVLVLLRILWRVTNPTPKPILASQLENRMMHVGHLLLYAVMILMPLTGYISTKVGAHFFYLITLPKFADTSLYHTVVTQGLGLTWEAFRTPIKALHKFSGAYVVWVLIVGHASAAIYHHVITQNSVLNRMLFKRQ